MSHELPRLAGAILERMLPPDRRADVIGDLTEHEAEIHEKLLDAGEGGRCSLYFDSPGGSAYAAISLLTLIVMRRLDATGIVTGECSSAAIWPLAACRRRIVTPYSVLRFHPATVAGGRS